MPKNNEIRGRVFAKETGAGLADLTVVVYDADPQAPVDGRALLVAPASSLSNTGQRLGSALTDREGRFALAYADASFAEERPDLLVFVFAPEEASGQDAVGKARLLHASTVGRTDAGRREAVAIAIDAARYRPPSAPSPVPVSETTLARTFQKQDALRAAISKVVTARVASRITQRFSLHKRATEDTERLFLNPRAHAGFFLQPGSDVAEAVADAFRDGLGETVRKDPPRAMSAQFLPELLEGWSAGGDGSAVRLREVLERVREVTGGGALVRRRSPLGPCLVEKEVDRLMSHCHDSDAEDTGAGGGQEGEEGQGGGSTEGEGNGNSDGSHGNFDVSEFTNDQLVRHNIATQFRDVASPEAPLVYGVSRDSDISDTVTRFRIRGGPADVRSFHDFQVLQVAFDPMWTSIVDSRLRRIAQEIYQEILAYDNEVSGVLEPERLLSGDRRDFETLTRDFEAFLAEYVDANLTPPEVIRLLGAPLSAGEWNDFSESVQGELMALAEQLPATGGLPGPGDILPLLGGQVKSFKPLQDQAWDIVRAERRYIAEGRGRVSRLRARMKEIDERLNTPYRFDVFAPNSMNFGILLTYRQTWDPLDYQVGPLVSTVPLAPKESRKYTTKRTRSETSQRKELEAAGGRRSMERNDATRADNEIVRSARQKTSFDLQTQAQASVGVFSGGVNTNMGAEAEKQSQSTKKNFREAVLKAAEEYKQESTLEIETGVEDTVETETSGELINPNDEITVTYLFYELQRQYRIAEQLDRVEPVILVANEVPTPDEIDEDWLMAHDWILRRVLLDPTLEPVLDHLSQSSVGDEMALKVLEKNVERQSRIVDQLGVEQETKLRLAEASFAKLHEVMTAHGNDSNAKEFAMALAFGPLGLLGGMFGGDDEARERREEVTKMALERADKDAHEVSARLTREVTALQQAIDKYTDALRKHFNRQNQLARLLIHVKENILHYMQAIWDHEARDQRYFRVYNLEVPWLEPPEDATVEVEPGRRSHLDALRHPGTLPFRLRLRLDVDPRQTTRRLYQVADLDAPLGYKGNYTVYRLKESSYLHDYMMQEYVDVATGGLRDPDERGNDSPEEIVEYLCCLKERDPERFAEEEPRLRQLLRERLADGRNDSDVVVVPSESLFIEALPGSHPIMEDFKLVHRALDVKKVQSEVRFGELENVRLASRLLSNHLDDPNVEKFIKVSGTDSVDVES